MDKYTLTKYVFMILSFKNSINLLEVRHLMNGYIIFFRYISIIQIIIWVELR